MAISNNTICSFVNRVYIRLHLKMPKELQEEPVFMFSIYARAAMKRNDANDHRTTSLCSKRHSGDITSSYYTARTTRRAEQGGHNLFITCPPNELFSISPLNRFAWPCVVSTSSILSSCFSTHLMFLSATVPLLLFVIASSYALSLTQIFERVIEAEDGRSARIERKDMERTLDPSLPSPTHHHHHHHQAEVIGSFRGVPIYNRQDGFVDDNGVPVPVLPYARENENSDS
uniref:Col_cuticle_N domain-containing protein n=1 Tax=Steinernema glaseri TaxID=37863 RepID=A0A1I8AHX9_9BILA